MKKQTKETLQKELSFTTFRAWFEGLERLSHSLEIRAQDRLEPLFQRLQGYRIPENLPAPLIGFLVALLVLFSRGPLWILRAQFFVEDGPEFYQNAHNIGVGSLSRVYMSYYHTYPRLVALFAAAFPVRYGPFLMAFAAISTQAALAGFLLSNRLRTQIPSFGLRAFLALLVVIYPDAQGLYANVAHSQFFLDMLAVAILCAEPGKHALSRAADYAVVAITAVTGPFAIVLTLFAFFVKRDRHRLVLMTILAVGALITISALLSHPRVHSHNPHRFGLLVRMLYHNLVIGSTLGLATTKEMPFDPMLNPYELLPLILGLAAFASGLRRSSLLVRGIALTGLFALVGAAIDTAWIILGHPGIAERYYIALGFSYLAALAVLLKVAKHSLVRWAVRFVFVLFAIGVLQNWHYPGPNPQFAYAPQIKPYASLPKGAYLDIYTPIERTGSRPWVTRLMKR